MTQKWHWDRQPQFTPWNSNHRGTRSIWTVCTVFRQFLCFQDRADVLIEVSAGHKTASRDLFHLKLDRVAREPLLTEGISISSPNPF